MKTENVSYPERAFWSLLNGTKKSGGNPLRLADQHFHILVPFSICNNKGKFNTSVYHYLHLLRTTMQLPPSIQIMLVKLTTHISKSTVVRSTFLPSRRH